MTLEMSTTDAAAILGVDPNVLNRVPALVRVRRGWYEAESVQAAAAARTNAAAERVARQAAAEQSRSQARQAAKQEAEAKRQAAQAQQAAEAADRETARERRRAKTQRRRENEAAAAAIRHASRVERARLRAIRDVERLDRRRAQLDHLTYNTLTDEPGDRAYAPARCEQLAADLVSGDLLYSPECTLDARDPLFYDARRGQSPRWGELVAGLSRRGLRITHEGAYYWRVEQAEGKC